jgi:KaiC/GvpD/RAD55 family RecA-like ATPase
MPQLKYETLGRLLERPIPAREYLIAPWLKEGESALVYAPPGVGKSMLTFTLALAAAGGGNVLNWNAPAPRRVLVLDGEMAEADLQERARVLLPTVDGIDAQAAGRNLTILARHSQDPETEFPDLGAPEGQRAIVAKCRRGKVDLIVLDNISTLFTSLEDENSAAAVRPAVKLLMRLKQAGIACITVHHSNKGGESYRGSTMLATTYEVIIRLTKGTDTRDDKGTAFEVTFEKFRGLKRDEVTTPRKFHLEDTGSGSYRWHTEKAAKAYLQELVEAVRSQEYASQGALAKHFKVDPATISRWKSAAIHTHGLITDKAWRDFMSPDSSAAASFDEEAPGPAEF